MDSTTGVELVVSPGEPANAESFFRAGVDLVDLLDEVAEEPVAWVISQLKGGSAMAVIEPELPSAVATAAIESTVVGLIGVGQGHETPKEWTPDAVASARRLAQTVSAQPAGGHLRLVTNDKTSGTVAELTQELAQKLDVLQPFTRTMPGAVRGSLVGLNVARGNRASLKPAAGRIIHLTFTGELLGRLKDAMLEKVEVRGQVRQDADGRIFHVRVEDVQPIVTPDIAWTDLFGLDPDITDGLSVADYLERSRGETR